MPKSTISSIFRNQLFSVVESMDTSYKEFGGQLLEFNPITSLRTNLKIQRGNSASSKRCTEIKDENEISLEEIMVDEI